MPNSHSPLREAEEGASTHSPLREAEEGASTHSSHSSYLPTPTFPIPNVQHHRLS
ncbi:hypothetical protein [Fischerella thermalis]|uniref:hypothetical protein n=1 Tax=Fischerella thermalis TaxID=372787 RepID=UPI0015E08DDD|nr:hypothetical protein [Fischerella thermalis]